MQGENVSEPADRMKGFARHPIDVVRTTKTLTIPQLAFVIATRGAAAAGIALLVGHRLHWRARRVIGIALLAIGAATTIPAAFILKRA
jgi:hypothetical protein